MTPIEQLIANDIVSQDEGQAYSEFLAAPVAPELSRAEDAFRAALPRLQAEIPGHWVAFHGEQQVAYCASYGPLVEFCAERLPGDEYLIRRVEAR